MKTDKRQYLGWGARLRLVGRILGVTGIFAALGGLFVLLAIRFDLSIDHLKQALESRHGTAFIATAVLGGGACIAALVLLIELLASLGGSGQRSLIKANAGFQIVLAIAVFGGLNFFSFSAFHRWDLTRDHLFTLPENVANELRKLEGKTTIVVLQKHKSFGQLAPNLDIQEDAELDDDNTKADDSDAATLSAAERKVVEKVKDLVDQFRLLGPQFSVVTLDVDAIDYKEQLKAETAKRPGLKKAIAAAPENSIFFYADDKVETLSADEARRRIAAGRKIFTRKDGDRGVFSYEGNIPRLSFNEFYQLDKSASKAAHPVVDGEPRGNLVLRPQGVEAFARRVLAIQEKKPKVGLLVIHEWLTTKLDEGGQKQFTAYGLRRSLKAHGFDVVDVLLKRWPPREEPTPAAYNVEETEFERLEAELESVEEDLRGLREEREKAEAFLTLFRNSSLADLNKKFRVRVRREIDEEFRQLQIRAVADALMRVEERTSELQKSKRDTEARVKALMSKERAFEDRRVTDVKTKLQRITADCDLLIIPRHTLINTTGRQYINSSIYRLSTEQVEVIKEFMKAGKPVLACVGPNNEEGAPPSLEPLDDFERLLADRGIELGRQTVLFDAESKGFAARQAGNMLGGAAGEIPPVTFPEPPAGKKPNPIAQAMRATARSADQQLEIRLRYPRPLYLMPGVSDKLPFAAELMTTSAAAWNEEQPFPSMRQVGPREVLVNRPRYDATPFDDPKKGTNDEERRGPFTVGLAVESVPPVEWYDKSFAEEREAATLATPFDGGLLAAGLTVSAALGRTPEGGKLLPQTVRKSGRLVVMGQGGLFTGEELSPATEQLLLHSCNWLLKRDERLPREDGEWSYPRIHQDEQQSFLWKYGPFLGLPAFFLYLGLNVLIVRRVR